MNECDIFMAALEIDSADERSAWLDQTCADDRQLRQRVEKLLSSHSAAGSMFDHPAVAAVTHLAGDSGTTPNVADISLDFLEPTEAPDSLGRLGPYEILAAVGRGGMGIVLKAHDANLNRIVAVKVLAPELAANATARKRFAREAQAAAAVSHDHVVTIYAVEDGGPNHSTLNSQHSTLPYLVMEYIDGQSLQQKIDQQGPLELKEILRIGRQIAAGLSAAHDQGLIHRDVKPSNVLLQNGVERVKITDFGLARAVDDVGMTKTGEVTGTPQYMSPEQAQGHPVDSRSDLFSLGSVLYAMCTGRSPFRAESSVATLRRVCDDAPRQIREVNPDIPTWLIAVIDKLLAKDADERFQSAAEVSRLLERYLAHVQQPSAVPEPPRPATRKTATHRPRRIVRTSAAIACLLIVGILITDASGLTDVSSAVAATVVRVVRGDGTLVVRVDDPNISVSIDGKEVVITGAGPQVIRVTPGEHKVEYGKDGEPLKQQLVTIERGDEKVLEVTLEPTEATAGDRAQHRRVWAYDGLTEVMSVSPDARYVVYRDTETNDVAIHDLQTGDDRLLTDNGPDGRHYTTEAVFSPDGQWVAYNWSNKDRECALHVVRADGRETRRASQVAGQWIQPCAWTPDGLEILCRLVVGDSVQIAFVSVTDGSQRVIRTLDKVSSYHPILALSPDGQLVAYQMPEGDTDEKPDDVYVISADGQREYEARTAQGQDNKIVGWAPDGSGLLVRSLVNFADGGLDAVWLTPISNGEPQRLSYIIREALDIERPGCFTADGSFFYVQEKVRSNDELWVLRDLVPDYLKPGPQPESQTVWTDSQIADVFSISPDETIVAFRDEDTGDLAIRDMANGTVRRLSQNAVNWDAYPDNARISPDGRFVACEWRSEKGATTDLRVFPTNGGEPRVIYAPDGTGVVRAVPQDWSPDGAQILARLQNGDDRSTSTQIALISPDDGGVRIHKEFGYRSYENYGSDLRFSPDGRFIAYEFMPDDDSGNTNIAFMSADGADRGVLIANDSDDDLLDWTPDGDLLFCSNRRTRKENHNVRDLWLQAVEEGRPRGEPRLVMTGTVGNPQYGEFAEDGTYYHVATPRRAALDVFLATLDPDTGALVEPPVRASERFPNLTRSAAWSPDGRSLAYFANIPGHDGSISLPHIPIVIRASDTKDERVIELPNVYRSSLSGDMLRWSPDGTSLVFDGFATDRPYNLNRWGIYRLDVETEEVTTIEVADDPSVHLRHHGWSSDGTQVVLRRALRDGATLTQQYLLRNLKTGATTEIHQARFAKPGWFILDGAVSPNGELLALHHGTFGRHSILTVPLAGGKPQLLYETQPQRHDPVLFGRCLAWTPDGSSLIFCQQTRRQVAFRTPVLELWRIPVGGGDPEPLEFATTGLLYLDIHPDGRQIAFTRVRRVNQLRAIDDLLEGEP